MVDRHKVLTPDALLMMDAIARNGSFAGAARELGKVPSALTYSVRQLEDALDVLLFDRSSRQAQLTAAGTELLLEGRRLLQQMSAVANRVRRVASGWESELAISVDDVISAPTMFELVEAFCGVRDDRLQAPATRLRLRSEVLAGTWEALTTGQVDLAIGVSGRIVIEGVETRPLGVVDFVFCMAPHHPLARETTALADTQLVHHRAIAVADTAQRLNPVTLNLLSGQDVLTVSSMRAKLEALLRGLGCGFMPEPMVRPHLEAGHLVARATEREPLRAELHYAWHAERSTLGLGMALQWWLAQLASPVTQRALIEQHAGRLA